MFKLENIFLHQKPARLITFLKTEGKAVYQTKVSKEIDSTYAHTLKILKLLSEMKLVKFEESGRVKLVELTELGEEVANTLSALNWVLDLAAIDRGIDQIYVREVKGKLRSEMNRESISKHYGRIKERLKKYFEGYPTNISLIARKLTTRVDAILAEALGYPLETYVRRQE